MIPNPENSPYFEFADQLSRIGTERGLEFTRYSAWLILLSVEAWFEDSIPSNLEVPRDPEDRGRLASQIFTKAMDDPHIQSEMRRDGRVSFSSLLVSIADAAKEFITKGV